VTKILKVKTGGKFEEVASYSRVVAVDDWIFVSNTAGRDPQTGEFSDDTIAQTQVDINNIEKALAAGDATLQDVVMSRVFIQNPEHIHQVMAFIGTQFRGVDPATTATCPPLGSSSYLVEIEVTAFRGASKGEIEYINIG